MIRNYFKIAFRTLWKNRKLSIINITGLAVGIACSLLIFLYVQDETSYDRHHHDSSQIYRVVKDFINDDGTLIPDATTQGPLGPAMQREIPEVVKITRIHPNWGGTTWIQYGEKRFPEERVMRVDSSFFDVFTIRFLKGNPSTALSDIHSIIITATTAKRYFGDEDPMGKVLRLSNQPNGLSEATVTGVVDDVPSQSHFHFDFLMSYRRLPEQFAETNWGSYNFYTYVKVAQGTDLRAMEKKIQSVYEKNQAERYSKYYLQPLTDIHLNSKLKWELEPNGDRLYVYIFSVIGIFILLIASINYINLSTAKSSLRAKETGIRKVSGAERTSLVFQFLLESIVLCVAATAFGLAIAFALIPMINDLTLKTLEIAMTMEILLYLFGVTLFVGVFAGLFPALYLSSFKPVAVLKGFKLNERGALNLRKSLVVVQFTISIALIIGAIVIVQQMNFLQSAKLGFDKDQVLIVQNAGGLSRADKQAFLNSLNQLPGVESAATSGAILGRGFGTTRLRARGSEQEQQLNFSSVNFGFLEVVGIEIAEGRSFSREFPADTISNGISGGPLDQRLGGIIVNEQAVKEFGLGPSAVGKELVWDTDADTTYYVEIIGVAKNFHFTSLRNEIKPYGFLIFPNNQNNFTLKLSKDNLPVTLEQIEDLWHNSFPESPYQYLFMDETFEKMYAAEARFQKIFIGLVILGIIIACLGLFALATFSAEQRTKEIGIRKVLGASVAHVVILLSKDFLKLVFLSLLIAIPLSIVGMKAWLEGFAYRVSMEWWIFAVAAVIATLIAFLTISTQAFRAAVADPARNLKSE
jgi:putative ABC transport system permease protein